MNKPAFQSYAILTVTLVVASFFAQQVIPLRYIGQVDAGWFIVLPMFVWAISFVCALALYRRKALGLMLVAPISAGFLIFYYVLSFL